MRILLILLFLTTGFFVHSVSAQEVKRAIENVSGDVYRFQNNFHYSVFVITDNGVIVTDPINAEAASWLKSEIAKLTDQPITHLIYSHSHGDHASGGKLFGDIPNVITHANAPKYIDGVAPTERFKDTHIVKSGNTSVELTYLGPGHGTDLIAMVIRPENVGFIVDAAASKRLPYRDFPGSNVDQWIEQVRTAETLDFEILVGGHGPIGVKHDVTSARVYMEELRAEVIAGLKSGKSAEQLTTDITMPKYKDWASYDQWIALNVQGMARSLQENGF